MSRYKKVFPMVDSQNVTFPQIQNYLNGKGYHYKLHNGEMVFQKGDGIMVAARYIRVFYFNNTYIHLEAWIDSMGAEMGIEGFYGWAVKKPLRADVAIIEGILSKPGVNYVPGEQSAPVQNPTPAYIPPVQNPVAPRPVAVYGSSCVKCGVQIPSGGAFCPQCGHVVGQPAASRSAVMPEGTSKGEYFKHYASDSFYKNVKIAAVLGYICAGLNGLISIFLSPLGLIESAIFLGLTLGMHLGKNQVCAIGMFVYSVFTVVLGLILNGSIGGWLWLAAGITALITFINADKKYKEMTNLI